MERAADDIFCTSLTALLLYRPLTRLAFRTSTTVKSFKSDVANRGLPPNAISDSESDDETTREQVR